MDTNTYWRERETLARALSGKNLSKYNKRVQRILQSEEAEIQKEIESFYQRYADENGLSMADVKKRVDSVDLKRYQALAKQYVEEKDMSEEANRQMALYNLTISTNRLKYIQACINLQIIKHSDMLHKATQEALYEAAMNEYQREAGILGMDVPNLDDRTQQLVDGSFHGATWSDRIWKHQKQLRAVLFKVLQTGLIQGKNPRDFVPEIRRNFKVTKYQAERLLRTEFSRVEVGAQLDSIKQAGASEVVFIIANFDDTCDICKKLNGQHFKIKDLEVGVNQPPIHPNCRCSLGPYYGEDTFGKLLEYAKDPDSGDLTFEQWMTKKYENPFLSRSSEFVIGTGENGNSLSFSKRKLSVDYQNTAFDKLPMHQEFQKIKEDIGEELTRELIETINEKTPDFMKNWILPSVIHQVKVKFYRKKPDGQDSPSYLPLKKTIFIWRLPYARFSHSFFHELGHAIDYLARGKNLTYHEDDILRKISKKYEEVGGRTISGSDQFLHAMREDRNRIWKLYRTRYHGDRKAFLDDVRRDLGGDWSWKDDKKQIHINNTVINDFISMAFPGVTKGNKYGTIYGHDDSFYDQDYYDGFSDVIPALNEYFMSGEETSTAKAELRLRIGAEETFANLFSILINGIDDKDDKLLKKYLPSTYNEFLKISRKGIVDAKQRRT